MTNRIALWRDAPDADAAAALASLLDWASVIIEVPDGGGREGFFSAAASAFGFPEYFGFNWDAFEECLAAQEFDEAEDLEDAEGLLILWSNWADLARLQPKQFATAIEVFREVLDSWAGEDLSARVVLLGEGPHFSLGYAPDDEAEDEPDVDAPDDEAEDEPDVDAPDSKVSDNVSDRVTAQGDVMSDDLPDDDEFGDDELPDEELPDQQESRPAPVAPQRSVRG